MVEVAEVVTKTEPEPEPEPKPERKPETKPEPEPEAEDGEAVKLKGSTLKRLLWGAGKN